MDAIVEQFFNLEIMAASWPLLLDGLWVTLLICLAVIPLGIAGGLLAALGSLARSAWIRYPVIAFVDFFRAIPPMVLLIFVYAGLPFAGLDLHPMTAVVLAFFLNNSAYYGEIFRSGILSVGDGQSEAGRSTGLSAPQTLVHIVLPQAVRNVLPDLISNTVEVVKLTALASVVLLGELLHAANMARSLTYNASPIVLAAGIYLIILWPLVRLVSHYERRIAA